MRTSFSVLFALLLSGCVVLLDHPDAESVQGVVVRSDNGAPEPNAKVVIWEGRRFFTLFPISYPLVAKATTDANGAFAVSVANRWPARITAHTECLSGAAEPNHADIREVVIRLSERDRGCQ